MKLRFSAVLIAVLALATGLSAQKDYGHGLQEYQLENGLTVYLWPDTTQSDVHGRIVTRAGAIDEPDAYTGLAHYLEHMLFKGTNKIGALNWEKEEPLYKEIIKLYDEFCATTDPARRLELTKAINEKSMEAAKYTATDEFSNLTESYGGDNLNAFTSYDMTCYFNDFPAVAMEKWLDLNSERLMNPVFRSFQAELENVFEEYNMYQDELGTHTREFINSHIFKGTPYERDVIGFPEHLKNPNLTQLIKFYNTWYVPNNQALLLVGNFDPEVAKPLIEKKFGRLVRKDLPARNQYKDTDFSKKEKYSAKLGYMPTTIYVYNGVETGNKDELALEFVTNMLNNSHSTGLLDRLMLDNVLSTAYAYAQGNRIDGRIILQAVPYYDVQQRKFESDRATEKLIFAEIDKIKNGTAPDWLFNTVKQQMLQEYKLMFESNSTRVNILTYAFAYSQNPDAYLKQNEEIQAMTKERVQAAAKKYFNDQYMVLSLSEGDPKKNKLAKPEIKPLDPPKGEESPYAVAFKQIPQSKVNYTYNNFNDVKSVKLYDGVNMFYTPNTKNDVFNLTLRYGVGTKKMPKLEYAASLLNSAGMTYQNVKAQDLRRMFSELGASCSFGADDSYFYINVVGEDKNLKEICNLMTKQALMPNLDDEQVKSIVSRVYFSRFSEKKNSSILSSAVLEYILYGQNSHFIDRIPMDDLYKYSVVDGTVTESYLVNKTNLTTTIQEATSYAVDIHYCGSRPVEEVAEVMKANTPIKEHMLASDSPYLRERQTYQKSEIYFMPDSRMQQAKIYFYVDGQPYSIQNDVIYDAFNQYFGGGFSGLVMNEIREKRSMAYTATGNISTPSLPGKKTCLFGYVGTQPDKVADAIDTYLDLLTNMPDYPDRIENIKNFLRQSALAAKPGMRSKSQVFEYWKRLGYTDDPGKVNMQAIDNLTYDQIKAFYDNNIKGKAVTVVVVGDPKTINMKQIKANHGKVVKVNPGKLFKGGI